MKKIKGIVFLTILFCAYSSFSQTNSNTSAGNPALKEAAIKDRKQKTKPSTNNKQPKKVATVSDAFQIDENDQYQGRKEEFMNQMTVKEMPSDFPKYEKWMGVKHYNEVIEEYYKKHLDIVKEKVKNKLLRN